jgi:chromosome segregation ATPase
MSFKEFINSLLTEEVPEGEKEEKNEATPVGTSPEGAAQVEAKAVIDQRAYEMIMTSIKEKGSGYEQFMKMLASLEKVIPDEATRHQSALVALQQVSAITAEGIDQSLQKMINALKVEREKFKRDLAEQTTLIDGMVKELETLMQKITQLQNEAKELETQKNTAQARIDSEKQKLERSQAGFEAALKAVEDNLKARKEKFKTLLKGGA